MLYPLKFQPILKDKIWGGQKLKTLLNKDSNLPNIGESWEISDVEDDTSIVSNGNLKGKSLKDLLETYKADLLGERNYQIFGNKFPLLIKFIDAKEDLSIQLHPNDELAAKRHNSFGKTEMWYTLQADEGSNLIVGFNQDMTPEKYLSHLKNKIRLKKKPTLVAGVMVAEIQQTSDITYRVYDWDRVDDNGNERDLHNDLAIDAFDFNMPDNFRVEYSKKENESNEMVSCPYFKTSYLKVTKTLRKVNNKDSFFIYMCVDGEAEIAFEDYTEHIKKGETILLPAAIRDYEITSKNASLLEVYV